MLFKKIDSWDDKVGFDNKFNVCCTEVLETIGKQ